MFHKPLSAGSNGQPQPVQFAKSVAGATPACLLEGSQQNEPFPNSSSVGHTLQPNKNTKAFIVPLTPMEWQAQLCSLIQKYFSCLIFFVPFYSIHTSICKTWELEAAQVSCHEPATAPHGAIYSAASTGKAGSRAGQQ